MLDRLRQRSCEEYWSADPEVLGAERILGNSHLGQFVRMVRKQM